MLFIKHEKEFKLSGTGLRVRIIIDLIQERSTDIPKYAVTLYTAAPRMKTFNQAYTEHGFKYHAMTLEQKAIYRNENLYKYLTPKQVLQAKQELWNKFKPE